MIKCRTVVSNANLKGTIFNLVGQDNFDADFIEQARAVRLNNSSTQVYIALQPGEILIVIEHKTPHLRERISRLSRCGYLPQPPNTPTLGAKSL